MASYGESTSPIWISLNLIGIILVLDVKETISKMA